MRRQLIVLIALVLVVPAALARSRPLDVAFARPVSYPTGTGPSPKSPWAVAVSDLNRDGKPDLAVVNAHTADVAILLGRGNGTFSPDGRYAVGGQSPASIATGDFNGDATPDLAVSNAHSHNVSVLLGRGDASLGAATTYETGSLSEQLAVGDLNGDGKLDLAVPNLDSNDVSVLMGNGDGTFAAAITSNLGALRGPFAVAIGDLNRDGNADLVVANLGSTTLAVLLGDGSGSFPVARNVPVIGSPGSVGIGDFNRDGELDVVAASALANAVSVLLGRGDGTFGSPFRYATHDRPQRVAIADLNRDGKLDLVSVNFDSDHLRSSRSNDVSVLLGLGNGRFTRAEHFSAEIGANSLAIKDLNDDRRPDIVTANFLADTVSVFLQRKVVCRIPRVEGMRLPLAMRAITAAHCSSGTIKRVFSPQVEKGRVISQQPHPGMRLAAGGAVNLVISKGKKPN
jgi:FG-GAP-like repeat/PASTA domain